MCRKWLIHIWILQVAHATAIYSRYAAQSRLRFHEFVRSVATQSGEQASGK